MTFDLKTEINKAKTGDLKAFEAILKEFERPILNFLFRRINNSADAEDLAQETFLKLYSYLKKIDPEQNVKSLIFTIANNLLNDHLRRKQRNPELLLINDEETEIETFGEDLTYYFTEEDRIRRGLAQLPENYRTAVDLYHLQSFSNQEISEILKLPLGTVKTRLARGRLQLKKIIEDHEATN